ncbi:MAG: carbamoyltransferase HypF [Phycisphaerales bacterium]|nr:carbamoyltransferase HypF [Phycisphaerales bacterium]
MPDIIARHILIKGVVQGVGFRPFIYRIAAAHKINGWVLNNASGVEIHAEASTEALDTFESAIQDQKPPASVISSLISTSVEPESFTSFDIRISTSDQAPTTRISPDLCVCDDCLAELRDPSDRRFGYPYINCTNCGPRYSIIKSLPYDRPRTTMADWPLCEQCNTEYIDPLDRRYHAQPIACQVCGPEYILVQNGTELAKGQAAIEQAATMLTNGSILAIKGIGGYHLACDAGNDKVINELRERKFRKEKPFAIMVSSIDKARCLVDMTDAHERVLSSIARPILLAPSKVHSDSLAPGIHELGVMLPYTPLHSMLFEHGSPDPMVLTSANQSNEPIAYQDEDAFDRISEIADAFLVGQRPIQRRVDDSVVSIRNNAPFIIRRARGYAPSSVATIPYKQPILAVGADLKNTISLAIEGEVFLSQHIGDLGDLETDQAFTETIDDLLSMYAVDPEQLIVAHDMHPEYVSTRHALQISASKHIPIQHHEAHIAAILLEHNMLDRKIIGIALDGTGYGRDQSIWGGEFFVGSVVDGFTRVGNLSTVSMPGGDAAARFPVQAAAAYLRDADPKLLESDPFGFPQRFRDAQAMVKSDLRCFKSSSAGRLFDAAAAICGFTRESSYEGQAAIWLENLAWKSQSKTLLLEEPTLDSAFLINQLLNRRQSGDTPENLAWAFHATLAKSLAIYSHTLSTQYETSTVALSGGVWQNALLTKLFTEQLRPDMQLLTASTIPCNDGGISAGQVALVSTYNSNGQPPR